MASIDIAENGSPEFPKKRKLARVKCERCRLDKQKCLPLDRAWPTKCDRCTDKGFPCSEGRRLARRSKHVAASVLNPDDSPVLTSSDSQPLDGFKKKVKIWTTLLNYHMMMDQAMKRLDTLKKRAISPFVDDWHGFLETREEIDGADCEQLRDFYAALEYKLVEVRNDLLRDGLNHKGVTPDILFDLVGQATAIFTWQTHCPLCFDTGDGDFLRQCTERDEGCKAYMLRLSQLSRHLGSRRHWDLDSPSRLQAEIRRLSSMSFNVDNAISAMLKELDMYDSLPAVAQANTLFRPDEINYEMYLDSRWEMDCLGRNGFMQALDALSDRPGPLPAQICVALPWEDVNAQDILGRTLLHIACEQSSTAAVRNLLASGANASLITVYGSLPLHFAAARGYHGICSLLLGVTVLGYDVNLPDSQDNTALYYAVNSKNVELVRFLLTNPHSMDPNCGSPESLAPLIRAIHLRSVEMVEVLLDYGADPRVRFDGCSASEYAAMAKSAPIMNLIEAAIVGRRTPLSP